MKVAKTCKKCRECSLKSVLKRDRMVSKIIPLKAQNTYLKKILLELTEDQLEELKEEYTNLDTILNGGKIKVLQAAK
jgi:hypothetical protein